MIRCLAPRAPPWGRPPRASAFSGCCPCSEPHPTIPHGLSTRSEFLLINKIRPVSDSKFSLLSVPTYEKRANRSTDIRTTPMHQYTEYTISYVNIVPKHLSIHNRSGVANRSETGERLACRRGRPAWCRSPSYSQDPDDLYAGELQELLTETTKQSPKTPTVPRVTRCLG